MRFYDILIHLREIYQEMLKTLIGNFSLKITVLKLLLHIPGANELNSISYIVAVLKTTH